MAAAQKLSNAPVPAWATIPGTMMKTDEAGVSEESVISSAPNSFMLRVSAGARRSVIPGGGAPPH